MNVRKTARKVLRDVFPNQIYSDRVMESLVRKLDRAGVLLPEPEKPTRVYKELGTAVWEDGDRFRLTRYDSGEITLAMGYDATMPPAVARRLCISLYSALTYRKGD